MHHSSKDRLPNWIVEGIVEVDFDKAVGVIDDMETMSVKVSMGMGTSLLIKFSVIVIAGASECSLLTSDWMGVMFPVESWVLMDDCIIDCCFLHTTAEEQAK